ncbi:MAG: hypothetical protein QUS13_04680, partial [Smithella sp.]|nr:hypothetical protein [Smithella sp.]
PFVNQVVCFEEKKKEIEAKQKESRNPFVSQVVCFRVPPFFIKIMILRPAFREPLLKIDSIFKSPLLS